MGANDSGFQRLITGSFTAPAQTIDISSPNQTIEIIQVTGTWSGALVVEGSNDSSTYLSVLTLQNSNNIPVSSITANGMYVALTNGYAAVQIRSSSLTSGTATINVYGSDAASLTSSISLLRGGGDGTVIGNVGDALKVSATVANTRWYDPGTLDIFGNLIGGRRVNQVAVDFSSGAVTSLINLSTTGSGASTIANGQATFSSGVSTTASTTGISTKVTNYDIGHEIYAEFTASFTTPTSANSFQRIGLYDADNGFFIGYNGTTFVVGRRSAAADTVVDKASWNIDTLTGGATSLFTRLGVPEAIDLTKLNVFRIRFGWLGDAPILFEVVSPDGVWVTFHKILYPNTASVVSIQNPCLPMKLEISKTSADATNLIMNCGAWAAGTTKVKELPTTPFNVLRTVGWGSPILIDDFNGSDLDYDTWLLPILTGTATATVTNSALVMSTGTTASNQAALSTIDNVSKTAGAPIAIEFVIKYGTTLVTNSHRFWGLATTPASPTASLPLTDAVGFEITTAGVLQAVIYSAGSIVFSQAITNVSDGLLHSYVILSNVTSTYFMVDSQEIASASAKFINPSTTDIPVHLHCFNHSTPPGSAPTFEIMAVTISDRSDANMPVEATIHATEGHSGFAPDPSSHDISTSADITTDGSQQLQIRGTVLTDEGSFREDFSGSSLLTTLTGTIQLINGKDVIIGTGTLFTSQVKVGDYIKKVSDNEVNFARVAEVENDTRLRLEIGYTGTTATGQTYTVSDWQTSTPTTGGGAILLASSIISMLPGTTSGNIAQIRRDGDYGPYCLTFYAALSQRIANQTTILGFVDDPSAIGAQASFQFTGTDNTKVSCVSAFSAATGDTQTSVITLANSATTATYHTYEVDITVLGATFLIDGKVVARHTIHISGPYQPLSFIARISNAATVTATTLNIDYVFFENVDRLDIKTDFGGEPIKASMMGISTTTGLPIDLGLDPYGNLIVSTLGGLGADFSFGDFNAPGLGVSPVRRTAYTEQTTNAQRSFASSSALDTAAGTGAQLIVVTYFDQTGAGPFTESVTLAGTATADTVATNICFIEEIKVSRVGATGSNAGIITMYAAINKGGAVIGTINATDNQTFWCHHYVAINKICRIAGLSGATDLTSSAFTLMYIKQKPIGMTGAVEIQVSDSIKLYGGSSEVQRNYNSPIAITGPARVILYCSPGSNANQNVFGSFDFAES